MKKMKKDLRSADCHGYGTWYEPRWLLQLEVDSGKGGNASITITLPTTEQAPTGTTTYKIYKVFDATSVASQSFFELRNTM